MSTALAEDGSRLWLRYATEIARDGPSALRAYDAVERAREPLRFARRTRGDVDVHPLDWLIGGVVDAVGVAQTAWSPGRTFQHRGSAVDGELSFAIQDDEHLLAFVMEVLTDTAPGRDDTAMQEQEIRIKRL